MREFTYEEKCEIWNAKVGELTYMFDVINLNDIYDEVKYHELYIKALPLVDRDPIWKDLMGDAEIDVAIKYAYSIYLAVKGVIEKRDVD